MHINISPNAPIDAIYLTQSANGVLSAEYVLAAGTNITLTPGAGTLTIDAAGGSSLPVADTQTLVKGSADPTKLLRFEVDGFTAGATRVMTPPNQDTTLAGLSVIETFTAKQTFTGGITAPVSGMSLSEAFGDGATVTNFYGTAIGNGSSAAQEAVAIGKGASAFTQGVVIGASSTTTGSRNVLIGYNITTTQSDLVLIGSNITSARDSVVVGKNAISGGDGVVIGTQATSSGAFDCVAIGLSASATFTGSIAIGSGATTTEADQMMIGGLGGPINKIINYSSWFLTNTRMDVMTLRHNSTITPLAGYGSNFILQGKSSTTNDQDMLRLYTVWNVPTHASRVSDAVLEAAYSGGWSEILRGRGGSSPLLSFLGATPIARPTTYTLAATATRTMPTPEATFTGQDNAQAGAVYAKSADLITLQTRLDSVEGVLRQLIIDLASTSGYGLLVAS